MSRWSMHSLGQVTGRPIVTYDHSEQAMFLNRRDGSYVYEEIHLQKVDYFSSSIHIEHSLGAL